MAAGRLYLVPALLGVAAPESALPARTILVARELRHVVAENAKVARAFLKSIGTTAAIQAIAIEELNERTPPQQVDALLNPARAGSDLGLMSDAGCPGVADPGARLVAAAHRAGIQVIPLVGPSSILLALMASGMNGQAFSFAGYVPVPPPERARRLQALERRSADNDETILLIETPYRNAAMADSLIGVLPGTARLCIAVDLCGSGQWIRTRRVQAWKQDRPVLDRRLPAVFLFLG